MTLFSLNQVYAGNPLWRWIAALIFAYVVLIFLRLLKSFTFKRLSAFAKKTDADIDDLIADLLKKTNFYFLLILSISL